MKTRSPSKPSAPLAVKVTNGQLVISIGIETLAHALLNDPDFDPEGVEVLDAAQFAQDTVSALDTEDEGGRTSVQRLLDEAMNQAIESGSDAVRIP